MDTQEKLTQRLLQQIATDAANSSHAVATLQVQNEELRERVSELEAEIAAYESAKDAS
jgi:cell division protein FtsB